MAIASRPDSVRFTRPRHLSGVELVSAGYRNRAFPTHCHDGYVIGAVIAGAERLQVRGSSHIVATGDVLQLHPDEAHSNRSVGPETLRYLVFYLPEGLVAQYLDGEALSFSEAVLHDRALANTVAGVHRLLTDGADDLLAHQSGLLALLHALEARGRGEPSMPADEGARMLRVREWIDEHLTENFGLAELATVAQLSVFRLAHWFKETTGLSPIAYRNHRRIAQARRLLLDGSPIAEIACQLGFADQSHLSRQFQRIVGLSPQRYRQQ